MKRYLEVEELVRGARGDRVAEALRLLACEVADARRYGECLPLAELRARIADSPKDPASIAPVTDGMAHRAEVMRALRLEQREG